MSYPPQVHHGGPEVTAKLRPAGVEPELTYPSGVRVSYLSVGHETHGAFGLYRWDFAAAATGPDPHFHRTMSEAFFLLTGSVQLHDGTGWKTGNAGDYLHAPPGAVHGFRNTSGEPASMLLLFAPGAPRESYFERLATLAAAPMDDAERAAFMDLHDTYWL